jgi:hypothetical protein
MHNNIAAGKFMDIVFADDNRRIEGAAKIVDDDEWKKVEEGVHGELIESRGDWTLVQAWTVPVHGELPSWPKCDGSPWTEKLTQANRTNNQGCNNVTLR